MSSSSPCIASSAVLFIVFPIFTYICILFLSILTWYWHSVTSSCSLLCQISPCSLASVRRSLSFSSCSSSSLNAHDVNIKEREKGGLSWYLTSFSLACANSLSRAASPSFLSSRDSTFRYNVYNFFPSCTPSPPLRGETSADLTPTIVNCDTQNCVKNWRKNW